LDTKGETMINGAQNKMFFAFLLGCSYIIAGAIQSSTGIIRLLSGKPITSGLPYIVTEALHIPHDILSGLILILLGTVFVYGFMELRTGIDEGIAYVYVGILLALIFAGIYVLVTTGNILEAYLLKNEDFVGWTLLDDLRPEIYLGLISLFAYEKWKKQFDVKNE
jgi:hypothetical protein